MNKSILVLIILGTAFLPGITCGEQATPPAKTAAEPPPKLTATQLDVLVAPIALYPDPMIAMILPASTVPTDIVLAARYVQAGKPVDQIDAQSWDTSVKGLARYPDVLKMMDENFDWTNQLGAAVIAQQEDVMKAVQTQRAKAKELGNLQTTPQQQVIVEKEVIQIVPADPQIIYVPQYNPQVVYVEKADPVAPLITFGIGMAMGVWLANDCDWHHHGFYVNDYHGGWHGYSNNSININNNTNININNSNNYWKPSNNRPQPRPPYNPNRPGNGGNSNLPSFRPPSQGGWNGGNGGNNRPGGNGGGVGSGKPGAGNNNRPGGNGGDFGSNKPGMGNNNRPGTGQTKPSTRPATSENKFSGMGGNKNQFDRENSKREPSQRQSQQRQSPQRQAAPQRQAKPQNQAAPQRQAGAQRQGIQR